MYSVKFLTDEEFDRLPAKDVHDKIGVAYPETGEAFVRQSGSSTMDVFTALHELEHLKGNDLDEHFDSENGCYYKKGSSIFKSILPLAAGIFLPQILPAILPGLGGAAGASAGYAANAGKLAGGMGLGLGSGTAAGSAAASAAGGGLGATAALGSKIGSLASKVGEGAMTGSVMNAFSPKPEMPKMEEGSDFSQDFGQSSMQVPQDPEVIQVPNANQNASFNQLADRMKPKNTMESFGNYSGRAF